MATNDDIAAKLDRIAALLQLAHRDAIESARNEIRSDKVNAAILDATTKLTPSGKLVSEVKKKTGQSPATIGRRIASLLEQGAIEKHGAGPATQYRATALI
jgi:Fic family protein